jgi:hypothetical protein
VVDGPRAYGRSNGCGNLQSDIWTAALRTEFICQAALRWTGFFDGSFGMTSASQLIQVRVKPRSLARLRKAQMAFAVHSLFFRTLNPKKAIV